MQDLRVTIVQSDICWHDPDASLARLDTMLEGTAGRTSLVILPEMFATGFTMDPANAACGMDGKAVRWIREKSVELDADITGSLAVSENGRFYNRLLWAKPDGELLHYDKRHLFRMAGEDRVYSPGSGTITVELTGWRIRPFICYDLRFPAWTRNLYNEYDLAIFTANWPAGRSEHWHALLRARAIENQCWVIGVNRAGIDGNGVTYSGGSSVIDYRGEVVYNAGNRESVHTMSLSRSGLAEYRDTFPAWKDADPFTIGE